MKYNRRDFLRTAGGAAIAGLGGTFGLAGFPSGSIAGVMQSEFRVAVLFEEGFPPSDHLALSKEDLASVLSGYATEFLTARELSGRLNTGNFRLFINPYGSAFPRDCWSSIHTYLAAGGNLLNLGGVPFSVPVRREGGAWKTEVAQTAHHKALGITQSFPIGPPDTGTLRDGDFTGKEFPLAGGCSATGVYELYYRFTSTRDFPAEDGTSGQRDAEVIRVVEGISASGDLVSAPVVMIDRLLGDFAGGRWVLANFTGTVTREALGRLVMLALTPRILFSLHPTFAAYLPGETPAVSVRASGIRPREEVGGECRLVLTDAAGEAITRETLDLGTGIWEKPVIFGGREGVTLPPGLYRVRGEFRARHGSYREAGLVRYETGFWVRDERLLNGQPPLTVRDGYFQRDGQPYPVTGTSYMSSDVHRKFLFEPNPSVWDRDFGEMKAAGINMVRTGIWTGWKNIMLDAGTMDEHTLRSIDAFMLTAARHGIPVIFTFFAFLPESWGGENPYLDPRSVDAQKAFVSAIADRYREAGGIIWDLINEPSFSSPERLWYCRPNYDRFEEDAWSKWLESEIGTVPAEERAGLLRERYRMTDTEDTGLPPLEDFNEMNIYGRRRPFRVSDYRLFAQEMFRRWSRDLSAVLRNGRKSPQMVTVGQDEGGTYDRPGPHFYADTVDFTCIHNWWYNDDLLWDGIITNVPGRANLVEETGVMFYETADSRPWRTERDVRDLLERKLAISFAAGGAGYINWIWDTNPFMDSENEAAIGLKRADGSMKPEFEVMRQYARYFSEQAPLMQGKLNEDVVLIVPHSNMFATRTFAVDATRRAVRAMEYHCRTPLGTVSEYHVSTMQYRPRVLLLPSPLVIDRRAWGEIMAFVEAGSRLIVSGPIEDDRFLLPAGRLAGLGLSGEHRPVSGEEHFVIDGREFRLGFRGDRIQKVKKCVLPGQSPAGPVVVPVGQGEVLYAPVPVELSESVEATAALYRYALDRARIPTIVDIETDDPSVLARRIVFRDHIMLVFVSEASGERRISYTHTETGAKGTALIPAQRTLVRFLSRKDGAPVSELNPAARE